MRESREGAAPMRGDANPESRRNAVPESAAPPGPACDAAVCLSDALAALTHQKYAEETIHSILFSLRKFTHAYAAAVLLKDPRSEELAIRSHCNLSYRFVNTYRRTVGSGLVGRLFYSASYLTADADGNVADYQDLRLDFDYTVAAAAPIELEGRAAGYLVAYWRGRPEKTPGLEPLLRGMAATCALALLMQEHSEMIERLRITDKDTGLYLFPAFCARLTEELKRAKRHSGELCAALMDMTNFREIVNTYGLAKGTALFVELVAAMKKELRGHDIMSRFGADEIIVYFPDTGGEAALRVLRRLQKDIRDRNFTKEEIVTDLNIGAAMAAESDTPHDLILRAQRALHASRVSDRSIVLLKP